jgi:hypothetical protein
VTNTGKTAPLQKGGKAACGYLGGRKAEQPFDGQNVAVGSCLTGKPVGDHGEKQKAGTSVGHKVPSSQAFLDERLRLSRPESRGGGRRVQNRRSCWKNLISLAKLTRDCRNHGGYTS